MSPEELPFPTQWTCLDPWSSLSPSPLPADHANILVRLHGDAAECASLDGVSCMRNKEGLRGCFPWKGADVDKMELQPLRCTEDMTREEGHWCGPAHKEIRKELGEVLT